MSEEAQPVANQYADYFRVNIKPAVKRIEDAIEETVIRLDEYSGLIDMVRSESSVLKCNSILACKGELEMLFEKVRSLEYMVARMKHDVHNVEQLVDKAELELGISTEGRLLSLFKPLFKGISKMPVQGRKAAVKFVPPDLFSTKDFLK